MGFYNALKERCNAGVELAYWVKARSNPQPGDRLTSICEEMLIGYHNNKPSEPNTKRVKDFFNFAKLNPDDPDEEPLQMNVFEYEKVTKLFRPLFGDRSILNLDQKPLALLQRIYHIMNCKDGDTVLDLGCGSGSASHAALLMGMNAMAIDNNPIQVRGTIERLSHIDKLPNPNTECGFTDWSPDDQQNPGEEGEGGKDGEELEPAAKKQKVGEAADEDGGGRGKVGLKRPRSGPLADLARSLRAGEMVDDEAEEEEDEEDAGGAEDSAGGDDGDEDGEGADE